MCFVKVQRNFLHSAGHAHGLKDTTNDGQTDNDPIEHHSDAGELQLPVLHDNRSCVALRCRGERKLGQINLSNDRYQSQRKHTKHDDHQKQRNASVKNHFLFFMVCSQKSIGH